MKESLVSQVDSTETLAPKAARGERLTELCGVNARLLPRFLPELSQWPAGRGLALVHRHPPPKQRGGERDHDQRDGVKDRRRHAFSDSTVMSNTGNAAVTVTKSPAASIAVRAGKWRPQ